MKNQIFNPYLPSWEYVPDGEPRVFGDRLYIFGSHDQFGGTSYCENDYVCWSAPVSNLADWKYEGVIYTKEQDPEGQGKNLYAPDVVQGMDGRYYLYYSAENSSIISVAVSDTPTGSYKFYGYVARKDGHIQGTGVDDQFQFDPAVLIDDDGRIYLYSGFKPPVVKQFRGHKVTGPFVMELESDMKTIKAGPKDIMKRSLLLGAHNFFEASSIRKFDNRYYYIYSSVYSQELCYAMSDRPEGPFTYKGVLYSNINAGIKRSHKSFYPYGNNHGSIAEINGEYYVFGHRHTNKTSYCRQGIADRVVRDKNGEFRQAEYTSAGLYGRPLPGQGEYPAYIACYLSGKGLRDIRKPYVTQETRECEEESTAYISNLCHGAAIGFTYFQIDYVSQVSITVRGNGEGTYIIYCKKKHKPVGIIPVKCVTDWKTFSGPVKIPTGIQGLYFMYKGTGTFDMLAFGLS